MKIFLCFFMSFTIIFASVCRSEAKKEPEVDDASRFTVIVDAGHGGVDGGAVGIGDVVEKDLNLDVSKKLSALLELCGVPVVMTRTDTDDTDGVEGSFSKKKDILNRVKFTEEYTDSFFISIHMNYSTGEKDLGFQVFFGHKNQYSKDIADSVYESVNDSGIANRLRDVKKAPSTVYLMKNITVPAVLVECGFISNVKDSELLYDENYRMRLAFIIFRGVVRSFR